MRWYYRKNPDEEIRAAWRRYAVTRDIADYERYAAMVVRAGETLRWRCSCGNFKENLCEKCSVRHCEDCDIGFEVSYDHCVRCSDYICEDCQHECEKCGGEHSPYCKDCIKKCKRCKDMFCIPGVFTINDGWGPQEGCIDTHECY